MTDALLLGIDIGGTKCGVALAQADGSIVQRVGEPTRSGERGPDAVLEQLATHARLLIQQAREQGLTVRSVGVSCGGPLDTRTGVMSTRRPTCLDWVDVPVKSLF